MSRADVAGDADRRARREAAALLLGDVRDLLDPDRADPLLCELLDAIDRFLEAYRRRTPIGRRGAFATPADLGVGRRRSAL